jgi:hypothetical protein
VVYAKITTAEEKKLNSTTVQQNKSNIPENDKQKILLPIKIQDSYIRCNYDGYLP